jgi:hypothetical protein
MSETGYVHFGIVGESQTIDAVGGFEFAVGDRRGFVVGGYDGSVAIGDGGARDYVETFAFGG